MSVFRCNCVYKYKRLLYSSIYIDEYLQVYIYRRIFVEVDNQKNI